MKTKLLAGLLLCAASASASEKSEHHLFNPTPDELMRDFATDRPDKTESAYSVDAGHFQIEADFVTASFDRDRSDGGDTRTASYSYGVVNLKAGLTNAVDLQVVVESFREDFTDDRVAGSRTRVSGFGDITLRLKTNLIGNDDGDFALALMPLLKCPTAASGLGNDRFEGGLIVPVSYALSERLSLGAMTEFDCVADETGSGRHASFINSITLGCGITEDFGAYAEFFSEVDARASDWVGTLDFGCTWSPRENLIFDAGVNVGVTRAAPDLNPFVGVSWRR